MGSAYRGYRPVESGCTDRADVFKITGTQAILGAFYQWQGEDLILDVRIQPQASSNAFAEVLGERLKIRITSPPIEGKANKHLTTFLAKQFKVPKSRVQLISGKTSRNKRLRITQPGKLPYLFTD